MGTQNMAFRLNGVVVAAHDRKYDMMTLFAIAILTAIVGHRNQSFSPDQLRRILRWESLARVTRTLSGHLRQLMHTAYVGALYLDYLHSQ